MRDGLDPSPYTAELSRAGSAWIRGRGEGPRGIRRLASVFREKWPLVVSVVAAAVAAGLVLWATGADRYKAEALMLVSPVAAEDSLFAGTTVLRQASAPTRDVETVARLIETVPVAEQARRILNSPQTAQSLLADISARPVAQSYLVAIESEAGTADEAAELANAFARAAVVVRSRQLAAQLEPIRENLRERVEAGTAGPDTVRRLADLEALGDADPTVQIETPATPPEDSSTPGLRLVLTASIVVGLLCGAGAALLADAWNVRIRNEEQLLELFDLPIVARIPLARRGSRTGGVPRLGPAAVEQYRSLQQNIALLRRGKGQTRSILFTSTEHGEGRTTTALNTALALGDAGHSVVLVDADFRRPAVARTLSAPQDRGLGAVLEGTASLDDVLVPAGDLNGRARALLRGGTELIRRTTPLQPGEVRQLIASAEESGVDFVVFDAPPLGVVADALPIATMVEDVFVIVLRDHTRVPDLTRLADTLANQGVVPRGIVLIGADRRDTPLPAVVEREQIAEPTVERT